MYARWLTCLAGKRVTCRQASHAASRAVCTALRSCPWSPEVQHARGTPQSPSPHPDPSSPNNAWPRPCLECKLVLVGQMQARVRRRASAPPSRAPGHPPSPETPLRASSARLPQPRLVRRQAPRTRGAMLSCSLCLLRALGRLLGRALGRLLGGRLGCLGDLLGGDGLLHLQSRARHGNGWQSWNSPTHANRQMALIVVGHGMGVGGRGSEGHERRLGRRAESKVHSHLGGLALGCRLGALLGGRRLLGRALRAQGGAHSTWSALERSRRKRLHAGKTCIYGTNRAGWRPQSCVLHALHCPHAHRSTTMGGLPQHCLWAARGKLNNPRSRTLGVLGLGATGLAAAGAAAGACMRGGCGAHMSVSGGACCQRRGHTSKLRHQASV